MATNLSLMSFFLEDETGQRAALPLYANQTAGQTDAQMITEAQTAGTFLNALTGAKIFYVTFGLIVPLLGGWRASPAVGSSCQAGAVTQFTNAGNSCKYGVTIPSILPSKLFGPSLNLMDTDVQAWIGFLTANAPPYQYCTAQGGNLVALATTFRNVRKPAPRVRPLSIPS